MSLISLSILSLEGNIFTKAAETCGAVVSHNLRKFVCYHQGAFIQYAFLAGEYHKAMKEELYKPDREINSIEAKKTELLNYLHSQLAEVADESFKLMQTFYSGRDEKSPRICIKVNFNPARDEIVSLFREQEVGYISDCIVNENKGFQYVKDNGNYYLCHDIPKDAISGEYYNPRLIPEAVANYKAPGFLKRSRRGGDSSFIDDAWVNCWKRSTNETGKTSKPHYRNCYKSTLIVPLTLKNNHLDARFLEKFNLKTVTERTIFGYLCFDHIKTKYFRRIFDVDIGYVFADILSLYLLIRFIYVDQSKTFSNVMNYLSKNKII
jgi:hypothetical protein